MSLAKLFVNKKFLFLLIIAVVFTAAIYFIENIYIFQQDQPQYVKILFVGDLMFDRGIRYSAQKNGDNRFIFNKISHLLLDKDLVVANLEGPVTDEKSVSIAAPFLSEKSYFFTFDPSLAKTLYDENIRLVSLGNNHILNFSNSGLKSTKKYLDEADVGYFGSPDGPRAVTKEINEIKISFISYNEFSNLPNGQEEKDTLEEIKKTKALSDLVIIFNHWGIEYNLAPEERVKDLAHQFVDAGADLVIGSHPHVIQPFEEYKNKRIYYSLGNFIFDQYFDENVRNGLGVEVKVNSKTKELSFLETRFYLDKNGQTTLLKK